MNFIFKMLVDMLKAQGNNVNRICQINCMLLQSAQTLVRWVWRYQNTWECEMVKIFPKYNMNIP